MPSARKRSIFHLEEEGEREKLCASNGVSLREAKDGLVGLRILIQHTQGMGSNVVIKSSVLKPLKKLEEARDCDFFAADFLRSCLLCRKELGLQNEVFMYRGDQGFCSVECRCKQILQDERREFERTKREEAISSKARASDQRDDISVA